MPKKKISGINDDFDLKLFATIARKNFIWLFIFLTVAISAAYIYLRYTPPVYEAQSVIKLGIENRANTILDISKNLLYDAGQIAGEIELIRSKVIIERAIKKLPLEVSYFAKGTVLTKENYRSSPFTVDFVIRDSSIMGVPVYIDFESDKKFDVSYNFQSQNFNGTFYTEEWIDFPGARIKISIDNYEMIRDMQNSIKANVYYFVINNPESFIRPIINSLSVQLLNPEAKTILIKFQDYNSKKTADVVNTISNEFIKYDFDRKAEGSEKILKFIDQTLESVSDQLSQSEILIENFKKENKIVSPVSLATNTLNRINELETQKVNAELDLYVLNKIEESIRGDKELDNLIPLLSGYYTDGIIADLIIKIQDLQNEKADVLRQVTPESEQIKNINTRIENQKKVLAESIRSSKKAVEDKRGGIQNRIYELETTFGALPSKEAEFSRLERIFSINERFYSMLLQKKAEFSITKAGFVSNNIILEPAIVPTYPVSPNRTLILSLSILLGIMASFVLFVFRYLFYNELSSLEEIEQYTDAPLLGLVPKYKREIPVSQLLVDKNPKSVISEAFRSIRTNLQFISNEMGSKVMAVTSTISSEGKTFVAINLGGVIAFSGKRVVIIDLDMRKPKIHLGFNVANEHGVSSILIGNDNIDSCIRKSNLENLHFITAGPIPPNPSELIISKQMDDLIIYLKTKYDVIIIDTPPVGIVTDGVPIIKKVDYPLYIIRANYSKKVFIQNINKLIEETKVYKLSVILNSVEMAKLKYGYGYGYGYSYGYGYGYGYGYYSEDHIEKGPFDFIKNIFKKNKN